MPTKKESKVVGSFNIGKMAAVNIIKNETSIRKEYGEFKGDLKRKRNLMTLAKYCTRGLKNVEQQISILMDRC